MMITPCLSEGNIAIRDHFKVWPFLHILAQNPIKNFFTSFP
ncbi:hypothetical protein BTN49_0734 [Candidatus Enterovibrio escicola]|uniref:Uncharacterized protein n=1 Tax=Candidatus Enterovibrio escicola TaxID=1927127 RepID=A0A2A5T6F7_9GAMM|nr:hypothetical protein BTN49_0734 [Candidatus Enterovibrio escacola]